MENSFSHQPIAHVWDNTTYNYFENHINSHHEEFLKAIYLIWLYINAIKNGKRVLYLRNKENTILSNLSSFQNLVLKELSKAPKFVLDWVSIIEQDISKIKEIAEEVEKKVTEHYSMTKEEAIAIAQKYIDSRQGMEAKLNGQIQWLSGWGFTTQLNHPVWVVFAKNLAISSFIDGVSSYSIVVSTKTKKVETTELL